MSSVYGMFFIPLSLSRTRLESEAEELTKAGDTESERLMDIYERLDELDAATAETKAARILHGLGGCGLGRAGVTRAGWV